MAKDDLYSFDDKSIDFNTSDLDEIISNDEILKNFKDDSKESLIFDEEKAGSLKEEPVLESLDSLEQKEEVLSPAGDTESEPVFSGNDEKILFSDESGSPVSMEVEEEKPLIIHDQETEQFVQEEISREIKTEKEMSGGSGEERIPSAPEQKSASSFFEEDEDETISLSSDELSNILEDTEEADLSAVPTVDKVLGEQEKAPGIGLDIPEATEQAGLMEEPVASEEISLDEIPMEQIDFSAAPSAPEESPALESGPEEPASSFFEEDEDESIGLTNSELDNILKSSEIVEERPVEEAGEPAGGRPGGVSLAADGDPDRLKKILKYLDGLLDYLPEEKIKEFAESEYYELYHSLFEDLKI